MYVPVIFSSVEISKDCLYRDGEQEELFVFLMDNHINLIFI